MDNLIWSSWSPRLIDRGWLVVALTALLAGCLQGEDGSSGGAEAAPLLLDSSEEGRVYLLRWDVPGDATWDGRVKLDFRSDEPGGLWTFVPLRGTANESRSGDLFVHFPNAVEAIDHWTVEYDVDSESMLVLLGDPSTVYGVVGLRGNGTVQVGIQWPSLRGTMPAPVQVASAEGYTSVVAYTAECGPGDPLFCQERPMDFVGDVRRESPCPSIPCGDAVTYGWGSSLPGTSFIQIVTAGSYGPWAFEAAVGDSCWSGAAAAFGPVVARAGGPGASFEWSLGEEPERATILAWSANLDVEEETGEVVRTLTDGRPWMIESDCL